MKKIMLLTALVLSIGIYSNLFAQQSPSVTTPSVSGDKSLRDMDAKTRSIDLERVKRDADKPGKSATDPAKNTTATAEDKLAAKYAEIKTDYEQIQLLQDAIIKAYQGSGKIDYAQISKSAVDMNKSAVRLSANLFPAAESPDVEKGEKKESTKEKETKPAKSVRDLIVELDSTIGSFATSPMFQNLRVVDALISEKAKLDLEKIIELSALLYGESQKMAAGGK
jgi:hypothetical protein